MPKELCINEVCCHSCGQDYALFLYPGEIPAPEWLCSKCKLKEVGDYLKIGNRITTDVPGENNTGVIIDSNEKKDMFLIAFDNGEYNWLSKGWIHPGPKLILKCKNKQENKNV